MKTIIKTILLLSIAAATLSCGRRNAATASSIIDFVPDSLDIRYAPGIELGSDAPEFVVKDLQGNDISPEDFLGKYLVIDFWASWCGDCRREIPEMIKAYETLGGKTPKGADIEFLSISFDHEADKWKEMVESSGMPWPQGSNLIKWKENSISEAYGIHWIPTVFIVSPEGKIIGYALTAEKLMQRLGSI